MITINRTNKIIIAIIIILLIITITITITTIGLGMWDRISWEDVIVDMLLLVIRHVQVMRRYDHNFVPTL